MIPSTPERVAAPLETMRVGPGAETTDVPAAVGRYNIVQLLGKGGMGTVYLAQDSRLGRTVALKQPRFRTDQDPEAVDRFYREARLAGKLQHPNICPIFDIDEHDG